jgi:O-antigen/teichoic acid export membrane protein
VISRLLRSPVVWALGDQVLVSAANFVLTLVVARHVSLADFSAYGLSITVVWLVSALHRSYLTQPMAIASVGDDAPSIGKRLNRVLQLQALAWPVVAGLFLAVSWRYLPSWQVAVAAATFTASFLLQETLRRVLFVQGRMQLVSLVDALAYGGQLAAVLAVGAASGGEAPLDHVLLASAVPFVGSACLAYACLPAAARAVPWSSGADLRAAAREHWSESRWVCFSQVFMFGSFMLVPFHIAEWGKPLWVAQYNATASILNGLNVLRQALGNHLPIEAARRFQAGGLGALRSYLWRASAWILALSALIMVVLVGFGELIVHTLFGARFEEAVSLLPHAAVGQLLTMLALVSQAGGLVIKRTEQIFWAYVVGTILTFGMAPLLITQLGLVGAVWLSNVGVLVPTLWHVWAFRRDLNQLEKEGT